MQTLSGLPLNINGVSKSFGKKKVLNDVSLEVKSGEIFGLIGLNGAGKTTMIKIILGLLRQDIGDVSIYGGDVEKPATRKNLSFLPEKFQPSAFLKGREFLSLTLSYYGKKYNHKIAQEMSKKLDLDPDALNVKITKYSKGMGQKLGLLSAFLTEAPLLMLDEPMSGLDPSARIHLKDALLDYVNNSQDGEDRTIFFSSHILSDIDEICNKIAVLHNNEIVFTGTPLDFKKKYNIGSLERAFLKSIKEDVCA